MNDDYLVALDEVRDIPWPEEPASLNGDQTAADPANTWQPANLIQLAANPPAPPTIGGLLYPAKRTVLSGETESMKTWLALILCKAELDIGLPVGWVDLDAMGPGALLERLQLLGVTDEQIADDFLYYEPSEMLDTPKIQAVAATIAERQIRLFVIDAFNPILSLHGLEPNSTPDIETFWRTIADPIATAGAAPVLLDHVVKNAENRGKYSYGSERKASGATVHLGFRLLEPLTKGGRGRTLLTVHKDRPGYLPRPTLGRLVITSHDDQISYTIEADKSHDTGGFRPTVLMEKISRQVETQTDPVAKGWIEETVSGKTDWKRAAIEILAYEGHLEQTSGPRGSLLYTSTRPYREADDTPGNDLAPTSPHLAPNLRSTSTLDLAPAPPHEGRGARSDEESSRGEGRGQTSWGEVIHEYDHPPTTIEEQQATEPDDDNQLEWWKK